MHVRAHRDHTPRTPVRTLQTSAAAVVVAGDVAVPALVLVHEHVAAFAAEALGRGTLRKEAAGVEGAGPVHGTLHTHHTQVELGDLSPAPLLVLVLGFVAVPAFAPGSDYSAAQGLLAPLAPHPVAVAAATAFVQLVALPVVPEHAHDSGEAYVHTVRVGRNTHTAASLTQT